MLKDTGAGRHSTSYSLAALLLFVTYLRHSFFIDFVLELISKILEFGIAVEGLETKTAGYSLCFIAFHGERSRLSLGQRSRIGRSSVLRPSFRGKASHVVVRYAREGVFFSEQLASRSILSPLQSTVKHFDLADSAFKNF